MQFLFSISVAAKENLNITTKRVDNSTADAQLLPAGRLILLLCGGVTKRVLIALLPDLRAHLVWMWPLDRALIAQMCGTDPGCQRVRQSWHQTSYSLTFFAILPPTLQSLPSSLSLWMRYNITKPFLFYWRGYLSAFSILIRCVTQNYNIPFFSSDYISRQKNAVNCKHIKKMKTKQCQQQLYRLYLYKYSFGSPLH